MKKSQRIELIQKISSALEKLKLADANLILRNFDSVSLDDHNASEFAYLAPEPLYGRFITLIENLEESALVELYEYLYPGAPLPSGMLEHKSTIWQDGFVRAFLSHSSIEKLSASQIKDESLDFGIDCFVAHQDIQPSSEWMKSIQYGLNSCDCLIALLSNNFKTSNFCDQEVGFALQRGVLIVLVSLDEVNPYGFMAPFQRVTAFGKSPIEIVVEINGIISRHPSLADRASSAASVTQELIVTEFLASSNFATSSSLLKKIESKASVPKQLLRQISENWEKNSQISGCAGIPRRIERLLQAHNFKPAISNLKL
jgi:hypothetical protein